MALNEERSTARSWTRCSGQDLPEEYDSGNSETNSVGVTKYAQLKWGYINDAQDPY